MRRLWLAAALCIAATADAKRPPPRPVPVGQALVKKLAEVQEDRLHSFAEVLGSVAGFPGTAPRHQSERAAFQKELAGRLGVPEVKLDVVVNAMVGDSKDPPVTTLTLQLTDEQLRDALETIQGQHGAKPQESPEGKVWTLGRLALNPTRKTLSWGFLRPPVARPDWNAASIDATHKAWLAIVRDPSPATLIKFVDDLKKRATQRGPVFWDDERASYSFNVTDSSKFIDIDLEKPLPVGAFLRELGFTDVTFENPCDADFIELRDARTEVLKHGKWSLELRTTYAEDYQGAVQHCTSHEKVKAVPSAKVTVRSARLSFAGK